MAAKNWSRQEEEQKLKDHMTDIEQQSSDLAKLSKKRRDALRAQVPVIHRQQENDVLQSAADWSKFYEDDTAWLQEKAKVEAQQLIDTNEALPKMVREYSTLRAQLDELRLVKKDPESENSQWTAINDLREMMLERPKMVQAFFGDGFTGKLEETFETKWSNFDERIKQLKKSVFHAVYDARDEVKEFLETDFMPRLGQTVKVLRDAHDEALDKIKHLESRCDDFTVRLDQGKDELAEMQGKHGETLKTVKRLEKELAELQRLRAETAEALKKLLEEHGKLQEEHAETLKAVERLKEELATTKENLANMQYSHDMTAENFASSQISIAAMKEAHQRQIPTKEQAHEVDKLRAAQEKDDVQLKLDALQLKFDKLQTSADRERQKHEEDMTAKTQTHEAETKNAAREKDEVEAERKIAVREKEAVQSELDALQSEFGNLKTSGTNAEEEHAQGLESMRHAHEAEKQEAARQKKEMQSKLDALQRDFNNLDGRHKQSELTHERDGNTIKNLEASLAAEKTKLREDKVQATQDATRDSNKIATLEASLAAEKNRLEGVEGQATRDSNKIATLEANLDEEKKKATQRHREMNAQCLLLASLDFTKTPAISSRPVQELTAIVTRAAGFTQSTANVEPARILDSNNSDLPEGTQLIADMSPDVFILITAPAKVEIFDKADIQRVEHDTSYRTRLIIDSKSLLVCGIPRNVEKEEICDSWIARYAEGVFCKAVEAE